MFIVRPEDAHVEQLVPPEGDTIRGQSPKWASVGVSKVMSDVGIQFGAPRRHVTVAESSQVELC